MNSKYNVLVVDDIEKNLQLIGNILQDKGISITFATNGKQAVKAALKKLPDLILLDIMMPEMDGYQVCSVLKEKSETSEIPIIFLTAKNEMHDLVKGFALGAVDYITKPFKKEELISRVFTHLELKISKDIISDQKIQLELKNRSIMEHAHKVEELNDELKDSNNKLKELVNTKDKFFSIISHDLKGPLSNILTFTEMFLENSERFDKKKLIKIVESLRESTLSSNKLLSNLLEWARSQTGVLKINPVKLDFYYITSDVIKLKEKDAQNKNISVSMHNLEEKYVIADEAMLNTVIRNLLSNSIKFTPEGGEILIDCEEILIDQKDYIQVEIKDNGIGISEKVLERLFQIDKNKSTKGTLGEMGTGLGLILCKEFIHKNKGKIWVESEKDKGSSFYFTLPLYKNDN